MTHAQAASEPVEVEQPVLAVVWTREDAQKLMDDLAATQRRGEAVPLERRS